MPKKETLPNEEEKKGLVVVVDQDDVFLRLEMDGKEVSDNQYEVYEEEVEKPVTPEGENEFTEGEEVAFSDAVAKEFGAPTGRIAGYFSDVEILVEVNGEEKVVGFDAIRKV